MSLFPYFGSDDAPKPAWPQERPHYESLQAAIQGEAARWNVPGIAAGISRKGELELCATGTASVETGFPVTPDTLFQIGSISKIFTATLVMKLVDQGKLDLDTPVIEYLDELPLANEKVRDSVTLRQLLSHTAGFEGDRFTDYGRGDEALATSIKHFDTLRQWFEPGTLFSYNNAAFYLAGRVIEQVTGKVFETVLDEEIFKPLKLERTVMLPEYAMTYAHAVGHDIDRNKGPQIARPFSLSRHVAAAGAVISCTKDMLRFAQMHINDGELDGERIISAKAAQEMREFIIPTDRSNSAFGGSYGIGWARWEYGDRLIVGHGGSIQGFRAHMYLMPAEDWAIIMLTNGSTGGRAMSEIKEWAFERELGIATPEPDAVELSEKDLKQYTGIYKRHNSNMEVTVHNGTLKMVQKAFDEDTKEPKGDPVEFAVEPVGDGKFRMTTVDYYGAMVEFFQHPAPDGTMQDLVRLGGRLAVRED